MSKLIGIFLVLTISLYANNEELKIYTLNKYNTNFNKLTKQQQKKVKKEYQQIDKLAEKLKFKVFAKPYYKVTFNRSIIDAWSYDFMKNYKPSKEELQKMFKKNKPLIAKTYKLRGIIVKSKTTANKIEKELKKIKENKKRLEKFEKLVEKYSSNLKNIKSKGNLGWISAPKLKKEVRDKLKKKKKNEVVTVNLDKKVWQVLWIEDYKPKREATFKEVKNSLIKLAKKRALSKEIKKLVQ